MKALILTGGTIEESFALPYMEEHFFDIVIGVDHGLDFLYKINKIPDYAIGDFDSVHPIAYEYFQGVSEVQFVTLRPEKDETDTQVAIQYAMDLGAKSILILGATGTRMDHVLGNISLLGMGLKRNVRIQIVDEYNRIQMIDRSIILSKKKQYGQYVSLIPYTDRVEGLTLIGMKYPLLNATMGGHNALGVSNEILEDEAIISFSSGKLLVIESK